MMIILSNLLFTHAILFASYSFWGGDGRVKHIKCIDKISPENEMNEFSFPLFTKVLSANVMIE